MDRAINLYDDARDFTKRGPAPTDGPVVALWICAWAAALPLALMPGAAAIAVILPPLCASGGVAPVAFAPVAPSITPLYTAAAALVLSCTIVAPCIKGADAPPDAGAVSATAPLVVAYTGELAVPAVGDKSQISV